MKTHIQTSKHSKLRRTVLSFSVYVIIASFVLSLNSFALAATETKGAADTPFTTLQESIGDSGLPGFAGRFHQKSSIEPGADIITSAIFNVLDFAKYLIGAIAVLYIIMAGVSLINAGGEVDKISEEQKESLKLIIYGLILIIIGDELVTKVFFGDYGECIASASNAAECAKQGSSLIKGLYSLALAALATAAIFMIALAAFRLITSAGDEETIGKQKKRIMWSVVGLIVAGISEFAVKGVLFPEGGAKGIDVLAAQKLVYNFTNFVAAFIGAGAFAMFFYGGYLYVLSYGNEEQTGKAKKIIIGAIIGIIVALAAYGIVSTVISYSPGRETINLPGTLPVLPGG